MSRHITEPCGTHASYTRGCRCDECRIAHNEYMCQWRGGTPAARCSICGQRLHNASGLAIHRSVVHGVHRPKHGTPSEYNRGCRCPECAGRERVVRTDTARRRRGSPPADTECPECGRLMVPGRGLAIHRSVAHGVKAPPRKHMVPTVVRLSEPRPDRAAMSLPPPAPRPSRMGWCRECGRAVGHDGWCTRG